MDNKKYLKSVNYPPHFYMTDIKLTTPACLTINTKAVAVKPSDHQQPAQQKLA